jgi:hypothetical protein
MERRLFLTGLLGVAGVAGIATILPREALAAMPMGPTPQPKSVLPDLSAPADEAYEPDELGDQDELGELDEGVQLAHYTGYPHSHRRRRRRRRVRRFRNRCRYFWRSGFRRRRCRREPYWVWLWFGI